MAEQIDFSPAYNERRFFGPRVARLRSRESGDISVDDSTVLPAPFNPLLCKDCQYWNDIALISSPDSYFEELLWESRNPNLPLCAGAKIPECLICNAVFVAAKTYINQDNVPDLVVARDGKPKIACNQGPAFGDDEYDRGHRVDYSRSAESRLRVFISIGIFKSENGEVNWDRHETNIIPRLCLRYTKTVHTRLVGVEPWEDTFFDVGVLKSWIRTYGNTCPDQPHTQTNDGTSKSFRNRPWQRSLGH